MTRENGQRWTSTANTSRPSSPPPLGASTSSSPRSMSSSVSPPSHHPQQHYSGMGDTGPLAGPSSRQAAPSYGVPSGEGPSAHTGPSSASTSAQGSWDEGDSKPSKSTSRMPEKSMILRRREANRLAAQRFRNRKKGYQDSLEERVRSLEQERDDLLERLETAEAAVMARDQHAVWPTPSAKHRRSGTGSSATFLSRKGGSGTLPPTTTDESLRLSGVEAANRRLQDENKWLQEENTRLTEMLDRWVEWGRTQPRSRSYDAPYDPPYDESRVSLSHFPGVQSPLQFKRLVLTQQYHAHPPHPRPSNTGPVPPTYTGRTSHSVPPYSHVSPNPQPSPVHSPPLSYSHRPYAGPPPPTRPPLERQSSAGSHGAGSYTPRGTGGGLTLPPLRLASRSPSGPVYASSSAGRPPSRDHEPLPPVAPLRGHPQWPTSPRLQHRDLRR